MKNINFSIITPTYNRAWCIERAIKSVLKQNNNNWELIIVDDGSSDNTKQVVKKYLNNKKIRYFYQSNSGVNSARNFGIKKSKGTYIIFLDSDDELTENSLNIISSKISNNSNISHFAFMTIGQNNYNTSYIRKESIMNFKEFVSNKNNFGELFFCINKKSFKKKLFYEDINGGEGILIWELIKESSILICKEIVRIYHLDSPDSLISSPLNVGKMKNIVKTETKMLEKFEKYLKTYNNIKLKSIYLVLARALVLSGERGKSLHYFLKGLTSLPHNIDKVFLYMISFFDYNLTLNNYLNNIYNAKFKK